MARIIGEKMSADFGQGVVIDNRRAQNTSDRRAIGRQGRTRRLHAVDGDQYPTLVMNQYLYSNLPYDPIKDFVPITLVAKTMDLLVVNAASDIKTAKDLIAKAKAPPGKLNCGAGTITTKLICILFAEKAGVDTVLLPYNGSAEVAHGILTKSVDFVFDGPSAVLPLVQSGDLRALAKLDPGRSRPARAADTRPPRPASISARDGMARACRAARHAVRHRRQARRRGSKNPRRSPSRRHGPTRPDFIPPPARPRSLRPSSSTKPRAGRQSSRTAACILISA